MGLFDFDWPFFYFVLRTCWITNIKREIIRIVDIFNSFLFMVIKLTAVFQNFFFSGIFLFFGRVARNTTQQVRESMVVFTLTVKLI